MGRGKTDLFWLPRRVSLAHYEKALGQPQGQECPVRMLLLSVPGEACRRHAGDPAGVYFQFFGLFCFLPIRCVLGNRAACLLLNLGLEQLWEHISSKSFKLFPTQPPPTSTSMNAKSTWTRRGTGRKMFNISKIVSFHRAVRLHKT